MKIQIVMMVWKLTILKFTTRDPPLARTVSMLIAKSEGSYS
jgi:hypothetical protein